MCCFTYPQLRCAVVVSLNSVQFSPVASYYSELRAAHTALNFAKRIYARMLAMAIDWLGLAWLCLAWLAWLALLAWLACLARLACFAGLFGLFCFLCFLLCLACLACLFFRSFVRCSCWGSGLPKPSSTHAMKQQSTQLTTCQRHIFLGPILH